MKSGRIKQDFAWVMPELAGRRVEALVGVVHCDGPDVLPIVVNMQLDDGMWHRFFLDVGFAVWEQWPELVDEDPEGDDVRHVNYGEQYALIVRGLGVGPRRWLPRRYVAHGAVRAPRLAAA